MKMQKFITPILIVLIILAGAGGYFFGRNQGINQGRSNIQKELQAKEEAYKKSEDAVRDVATGILQSLKYGDFGEVYNSRCQEIKLKTDKDAFVKGHEDLRKTLYEVKTSSDYIIDEVVVSDDTAKVRYTEVRTRPLLTDKTETQFKLQATFKFVDGQWCFYSQP